MLDKISYGLGLSLGQQLKSSGVKELAYAELAAGIQDMLEGNQPKVSFQEAQQAINKFFAELEEKASVAAKAAGEAFLAENAKRPGVKVTASGLQYECWTPLSARNPRQPTPFAYIMRVCCLMERCSTAVTNAVSRSRSR